MEWVESVKSFFGGSKKDLTDPQVRKEAFVLLTEILGEAKWDEFALVVRQSIIGRHPVQKPSFADMNEEMKDVQKLFAAWLE